MVNSFGFYAVSKKNNLWTSVKEPKVIFEPLYLSWLPPIIPLGISKKNRNFHHLLFLTYS